MVSDLTIYIRGACWGQADVFRRIGALPKAQFGKEHGLFLRWYIYRLTEADSSDMTLQFHAASLGNDGST